MTDDETTLSVLKTIAQALLEPAAGATSECGAALSVGDGVWQPDAAKASSPAPPSICPAKTRLTLNPYR